MEKQYYISREDFIQLKEEWKKKKNHDASDMLIYNILRNKPADNGFCPKTKNIQSNDEWHGFNDALYYAAQRCRPREKYNYTLRKNEIIEGKMETAFEERYGIKIPENMLIKFDGLRK